MSDFLNSLFGEKEKKIVSPDIGGTVASFSMSPAWQAIAETGAGGTTSVLSRGAYAPSGGVVLHSEVASDEEKLAADLAQGKDVAYGVPEGSNVDEYGKLSGGIRAGTVGSPAQAQVSIGNHIASMNELSKLYDTMEDFAKKQYLASQGRFADLKTDTSSKAATEASRGPVLMKAPEFSTDDESRIANIAMAMFQNAVSSSYGGEQTAVATGKQVGTSADILAQGSAMLQSDISSYQKRVNDVQDKNFEAIQKHKDNLLEYLKDLDTRTDKSEQEYIKARQAESKKHLDLFSDILGEMTKTKGKQADVQKHIDVMLNENERWNKGAINKAKMHNATALATYSNRLAQIRMKAIDHQLEKNRIEGVQKGFMFAAKYFGTKIDSSGNVSSSPYVTSLQSNTNNFSSDYLTAKKNGRITPAQDSAGVSYSRSILNQSLKNISGMDMDERMRALVGVGRIMRSVNLRKATKGSGKDRVSIMNDPRFWSAISSTEIVPTIDGAGVTQDGVAFNKFHIGKELTGLLKEYNVDFEKVSKTIDYVSVSDSFHFTKAINSYAEAAEKGTKFWLGSEKIKSSL